MTEEKKKSQLLNLIDEEVDDELDKDYVPSDDDKDNDNSSNSDDEEFKQNEKEKNNLIEKKSLTEEELKKKSDELWADLCSSVSNSNNIKPKIKNDNDLKTINLKKIPNEKTKIITEYEFEGEKLKVEEIKRNNDNINNQHQEIKLPFKRGLGINNLVAKLGKRQKLSILNKTKIDWDVFKKNEKIEDDLKKHCKDKNSFVEKQAFLQRADHRQFELEKTIREKNRIKKQN